LKNSDAGRRNSETSIATIWPNPEKILTTTGIYAKNTMLIAGWLGKMYQERQEPRGGSRELQIYVIECS
jgi:hypothetical protein